MGGVVDRDLCDWNDRLWVLKLGCGNLRGGQDRQDVGLGWCPAVGQGGVGCGCLGGGGPRAALGPHR